MHLVFIASTALLASLLALRSYERRRGSRLAGSLRVRIDQGILALIGYVRYHFDQVSRYVNRDVLVKGLHMFTYLALMLVRVVERKLTETTHLLRSFRKKRPNREVSPRVGKIRRGESDAE
jgi:hypothetical protein